MSEKPQNRAPTRAGIAQAQLPRSIWALGFVSLLMDVSSEMIHCLLPVFMVTGLGASATVLGLLEGAAEALALIVKLFSGALSDAWGRRKPLALAGYGLGAASKPLFALAATPALAAGAAIYWVFFARLIDRLGKGIRGAPRDALVADLAPPGQRGAAYGLRQALDTLGAFTGPLLAMALMWLWADNFAAVFAVAVVPGVLSVAVLWWFVREPVAHRPPAKQAVKFWRREQLRQLPAAFWWVVGIGAALTLARFSEAFLVLRLHQGGLALAWTPLVLVAMSAVYALAAYPLGKLADRLDHGLLLGGGLLLLLAADALLAWHASGPLAWAGVGLWGLHLAATQGLLAAMVAQTAPAALRGTAFGFFNLGCGAAMLLASVLAGVLWDRFGAPATFAAGAVFCLLAGLGLLLARRF